MVFLSSIIVFFALGNSTAQAQQQLKLTDYFQEFEKARTKNQDDQKKMHLNPMVQNFGDLVEMDAFQNWRFTANNRPEKLNFDFSPAGQAVGDVNGDGLNDFMTFGEAGDERTPELYDRVWKSAIYLGGQEGNSDPFFIHYGDNGFLIPVGDVNGDDKADFLSDGAFPYQRDVYLGQSNGLAFSGTVDHFHEEIIGNVDFDQDGFNDVFTFTPSRSDRVDVRIFWGSATDPLNVDITQNENGFTPEAPSATENPDITWVAGRAANDAKTMLFSVQLKAQEFDQAAITVVTLSTDRVYEQVQRFAFPELSDLPVGRTNFVELFAGDLNNDGYVDLHVRDRQSQEVYHFEQDAGNPGFLIETGHLRFSGGLAYPIGDLNDDGLLDYWLGDPEANNTPHIGLGTADLSQSLTLGTLMDQGADGRDWRWNSTSKPILHLFGDMTGDGVDDFLVDHFILEDRETRGRRLIKGSPTEDYSGELFLFDGIHNGETFGVENIGDANGDGVDDFGIVHSSLSQVWIYFGDPDLEVGAASAQPDQIIRPTAAFGTEVLSITAGDFNGDGFSDVVLSKNVRRLPELFLGSAEGFSLSPAKLFDARIAFPDSENATYIFAANAGDMNGDGADDLAFYSWQIFDESGDRILAFIFFGGDNISETPDVSVDLNDILPGFSGGFALPGNASSYGDINGDGFSDLVFSGPFLNSRNDFVHALLGGADLDSQAPNLLSFENSIGGFGSGFGIDVAVGDWDGDGIDDIIAIQQWPDLNSSAVIGQILQLRPDGVLRTDLELGRPELFFSLFRQDIQLGYVAFAPDLNNDGYKEVVVGSAVGIASTNAVIFDGESLKVQRILRAPNPSKPLGGQRFNASNLAIGDFNADGIYDILAIQERDRNDANFSSRMYLYQLPIQADIDYVTDVPSDNGDWVRIALGGALSDYRLSEQEKITGFNVLRDSDEDGYLTVASGFVTPGLTPRIDVRVPRTVPADEEPSELNTFDFRVQTFRNGREAGVSEVYSGWAIDNIVPERITDVDATVANGEVTLTWSASDANDFEVYEVVLLVDGEVSELPALVTAQNSAVLTFPDEATTLDFGIFVLDENKNRSPLSNIIQVSPEGKTREVNAIAEVTTEGGEVTDEKTGAKVSIPVDALSEPVDIEIGVFANVPEGANVSGQVVFLGPSGTTFSVPVEVTVPYDSENLPAGVAEEDLVLLRFNESTATWDELDSEVDTENKLIRGFTTHFSGFAAGEKLEVTDAEDIRLSLPTEFALEQNFPNPFNPSTQIQFALPEQSRVSIQVFDMLGRQVASLVNEVRAAGMHLVTFDAKNLASGIYMYRIQAGSFVQTKRMTLVK